jgi:hypothetical protein
MTPLSARFAAVYSSLALPLLALLTLNNGPQTVTVITGNENSGTYDNPLTQIQALQTSGAESKIWGTYSTQHLFDTYEAFSCHCQGLAWLIDGRFAISHSARKDRTALFVAQNGANDTVMMKIGTGDHPGGIQAAGKVVAVPIKGGSNGSEVVFMDCRNREKPVELSYLKISGNQAEAAGIAYDSKRACHWVITTNARYGYGFGDANLYKSNRKSLFDADCRFTYVATISNLFGSEAGTQILFDPSGQMYVAALYRVVTSREESLEETSKRSALGMTATEDGTEMIALSAIDNHDSASPTPRLLLDKKLSDSGIGTDFGSGWRWGGTIKKADDGRLEAVAVARTLAYGVSEQYTKTRTWSQPPSVAPTVSYTVKVYTGNVSGAGTDSNIYLTIKGGKGSTPATVLNPKISGNAFERNRTDTATLTNMFDVGTIQSIIVTSDDKYAGSAWYLGWISVTSSNGSTKTFTANRWIEKGKLTATLR